MYIINGIYLLLILISNIILLNIIFYNHEIYGLYFNMFFFILGLLVKLINKIKLEYSIVFYLHVLISLGIYMFFKYPINDRFSIITYLIFYFIILGFMELKFFVSNTRIILISSYASSILIALICLILDDRIIWFNFFSPGQEILNNFKNFLINVLICSNIPLFLKTYLIMRKYIIK